MLASGGFSRTRGSRAKSRVRWRGSEPPAQPEPDPHVQAHQGSSSCPGQQYDRLHDVEAGVEGSGGGPLVEAATGTRIGAHFRR